MERLSLDLEPVPPFRLDLTVWTLRRRPDNVVDRWDGTTYRRVLVADDSEPFEVAVTQTGLPDAPRVSVSINYRKSNDIIKRQVVPTLERLLGISLNLDGFYRMAEKDENLRPLANQFRGFKPLRFQSYFETLANAISCQQLTLTVGIRLLNRLVESYGLAIKTDDVGARNHLERWLGLPEKLNYDGIHKALKRWDGYGRLVYFHLLLKSLGEKAVIIN